MKTGRWRRLAWVAAFIAAIALVIWAWVAGTDHPVTYPNSNPSSVESDPGIGLTTFNNATRKAAPSIAGSTLDGGSYSLRADRGHVVVVNVWASWCGPCRAETPELVRLANLYRALGVRFVGLDTRDNSAAASGFAKQYAVPYPSIIDDGTIVSMLRGLIPVAAVPSTIVIDRHGSVAARIIGRAKYQVLRQVLETELARASGRAVS